MNTRKLLVFLIVLLLLLCFTGCSAASNMSTDKSYAAAPEIGNDLSMEQAPAEAPAGAEEIALPDNRKLIQTARMSVEVQELSEAVQNIEARIAQHGGYIGNSEIYNGSSYNGNRSRSASLTVRIPADRLDAFLSTISDISNVVSSTKSLEDVTLSYVATESRITALKTEETRLLELLAMAETMDDLLTIESRLTDVRTELEQVSSTLRVYDNQVEYATVYLSISQVKEYTPAEEPQTVWQRIGSGFLDNVKGLCNLVVELFIFLVTCSPYLLVIGAVVTALVFLIRKIDKKTRNRTNK